MSVSKYSSYDDIQLVTKAVGGSREAFDELISRYTGMLYTVAKSIVSMEHLAEEIVQDAFVDAYLGIASLKDECKFVPWIYGITKRKALNYVTRQKNHIDFDELSDVLIADSASVDDNLITEEQNAKVRQAINSLSHKNKEVIILYYFEEKTIPQISSMLSLPEGTVKSRLFEARSRLKEELKEMKSYNYNNLQEKIKQKLDSVSDYYYDSGRNRDGCQRLLTELEDFISTQDTDEDKEHALADVYLQKYFYKPSTASRNTAKKQADISNNGYVLSEIFVDEAIDYMNNGNLEGAIKFIDNTVIPRLKKTNSYEGLGQIYLWRGVALAQIGKVEQALPNWQEAKRLLPEENTYRSVAISALECYERMKENVDEQSAYIDASAERYKISGSRLIFCQQPGFSAGHSVMNDKQKMRWINYFASRYENIFYDTEMKEGEVLKSGSQSLTLVSYNENVCVPAGNFEGCMHLHYSEVGGVEGYEGDLYYKEGVGLIKADYTTDVNDREVYELCEYRVKGNGYFPFHKGNKWRYENRALPKYLYQCFENEITYTDGVYANLALTKIVAFKKGRVEEGNNSDAYIQICENHCDSWHVDDSIEALQKALVLNSSQVSSLIAVGGIKYLTRLNEYYKKGYRYCPSSYNLSHLSKKNGRCHFSESGECSFGPYRFGTRHEENRIFGAKPFRYLEMLTGCIWDDRWVDGYKDTVEANGNTTEITVTNGGTIKTAAGMFENTIKVSLLCKKQRPEEDYFFSQTHCGTKDFYFARGVGIVRFDFAWGTWLTSQSELISYTNLAADGSYLPINIGTSWEYDEINLTAEGYRAKRIVEICAGYEGKYYAHDMQEFLYLGTEQEYEEYKKSLIKN